MIIGLVLVSFLFNAVSVQSNVGLYDLNIIHYNDFHAHFDQIALSGGPCNPTEGVCIGGFSRLYTAVMEVLEAEPESILLNAGDTFQGTIWYNFLRWNVSQHFMNMLPHDAHVLGNHEFDHGIEGLYPYLRMLESTMLGANVNTTFEPEIAPFVKNHVIITRKNRKIGIIGILLRTVEEAALLLLKLLKYFKPRPKEINQGTSTVWTQDFFFISRFLSIPAFRVTHTYVCDVAALTAPIGNVIMEDELEAVRREAAILTAQEVDIIIVLSHVGYSSDMSLASLMPPEVDIIVGGHSHSLLFSGDGDTPDGSTPVGDYPTIVTQSSGHKILIVQAAAYTRYLGNIKVSFDDAGKIVNWEGQPIYLGTSIVRDPRIESLLEPWRQEVDAVGKEVLGSSISNLNRGCYSNECNLGSWACDGFLEDVMSMAEEGAWGYAHVCMINAGGIRANINSGDITTEALLMAMPFENYVQVYDLKGKYLLEALEFSVGVTQTNPTSFYSGRMLQIGGMRNIYNASAPIGSRVVSASIRCIRCPVPRYEPLDPEATYKVLTQNYIGDGGGGYTMLSNNRENLINLDLDYVMLQRYLRRQGTALRDRDGRIQIVY